jgi:hypothetical protein
MRPAVLIPLIVFGLLLAGAAWVEYSQHSGLMLEAASGDVSQLCASSRGGRVCPKSLRFKTRDANDPWSNPYRCRSTPHGLLFYTLGADGEVGGTQRDADIVCSNADTTADGDETCSCLLGDAASELLR